MARFLQFEFVSTSISMGYENAIALWHQVPGTVVSEFPQLTDSLNRRGHGYTDSSEDGAATPFGFAAE